MTSRISIIRECLRLSGNNEYGAVDDGSPEWEVAAAAWTAGCEWLLDEHDWNFATEVRAIATAQTAAPIDENYTTAYLRPSDALHIVRVLNADSGKHTDYRIVGNLILVSDTAGIQVEIIVEPDPDDWPGLFIKAIRHCVYAGIYRGLHKNVEAAQKEEVAAERTIGKSRPRTDMQEPGKVRYTSTLVTARSRRRG